MVIGGLPRGLVNFAIKSGVFAKYSGSLARNVRAEDRCDCFGGAGLLNNSADQMATSRRKNRRANSTAACSKVETI
jgi:hypothetical protein